MLKKTMVPTDGHGCEYTPFVAPAIERTKEERIAEIAEAIVKAAEGRNLPSLQIQLRRMDEESLVEIDVSVPLNQRRDSGAIWGRLQNLITQVKRDTRVAQATPPPEVTAKKLQCAAPRRASDPSYYGGRGGVIHMAAGAR